MIFTCEYCKLNILGSTLIDDGVFYHMECLKNKKISEYEIEEEILEE